MNKYKLFPTNVATFQYENHKQFKESFLKVYKDKNLKKFDHTQGVDIFKGDNKDIFYDLGEFFKKCASDYVAGFHSNNSSPEDYEITNGWINTIKPNNFLHPHAHRLRYLAATYYLQSKMDCGNLVIMDPRSGFGWLKPIEVVNDRQEFMPIEGTLTIFPGWLLHYVAPNKSQTDRISITANIALKK